MHIVYENDNYKVEQYDPAIILDPGTSAAATLNYAVVNKQTSATEHECASLPEAMSVALQLSGMLEIIRKNPEAVAGRSVPSENKTLN